MAVESISYHCPEKLTFSNKVEIDEHINNWWRPSFYNADLTYIVVPQKNFASVWTIMGVERISARLWLAGIDNKGEIKEVRSIAVASLLDMGYGWADMEEEPIVHTFVDNGGRIRIAHGQRFVRAIEDYSFVKSENRRYVVESPAAIIFTGKHNMYHATFTEDQQLNVDENGNVILEIKPVNTFKRVANPTDEMVAEALSACRCTGRSNFYAL